MPVELTADGSVTLWSERYRQHYHNRNGALTQAQHVFLRGTRCDAHQSPRVLEIGFGLGLNFLTTLADTRARDVPLSYCAFEFDPQAASVLYAVGIHHPAGCDPLWNALLRAWPEHSSALPLSSLVIADGKCRAEIHFTDATQAELPLSWATAVYLDGFSPVVNAELWTPKFLESVAAAIEPGGWLATYSAAGAVRRALVCAGMEVFKRDGVAGKREFLSAVRSSDISLSTEPFAGTLGAKGHGS